MDSITNKINEIRLITDINEIKKDVLIFTETNAKYIRNEYVESEFSITNYNLHTANFMKKGYRGIFCYTNCKIKCQKILLGIDYDEYLCVKLIGPEDLFILIVYRSPNSSNVNNDNLFNLLEEFVSNKGIKIIVGDFNFPNIDWGLKYSNNAFNSVENKLINFVIDNFLYQLVTEPTRCRGLQRQSILDLLIVEDNRLITNLSYNSPIGKSDHCVFDFVVNKCRLNNGVSIDIPKLDFNKGNYNLMNEYIHRNLMDNLHDYFDDDIDNIWNNFVGLINDSIVKFIPLVDVKTNHFGKNYKIRLPNHILDLINCKDKLWKKYVKYGNKKLYTEFKKMRNLVKRCITKVKVAETSRLAIRIKQNPKVFWQIINKVRKDNVKIDFFNTKDKDGNDFILIDDSDKANHLAVVFKNVFVSECFDNPIEENNLFVTDCKMDEIEIIYESVVKKLENLNKFKSAGPDNIFSRILVECKDTIAQFLFNLYKKSLFLKIIPKGWKYSIITPVFKKGDKNDAHNFRPVSLCCICCKILESIIKDNLLEYFKVNDLLDHRQYGFVKKKSTSIQLLRILDDWSEALDRGEEVHVIYTDFEKAFDRVSHVKLIRKLSMYGVNDNIIEWLKDYLNGRQSSVRVNGCLSDQFDISSGVPQGSVLGPVLFIIYVNDMFRIVKDKKVELVLYADDAKLYKSILSEDDRFMLQSCLNALNDWCDVWDVKINVDKCVIIKYGHRFNGDDFEWLYRIGNNNINYSNQIKDLGVLFNDSLSFSLHIQNIVNKCFSILALISRNFKNLTKDSFLLLYKSLVRSKLEYANSVWAPWKKRDILTIERVQKRATKMVKECIGLNYVERLKALELPTLCYRRIRGDMIMVYNMMNNESDFKCYPQLKKCTDKRTRGHEYKLQALKFNKNQRKHFFSVRIVSFWNKLPPNVVNADCVNVFKNKLDDFLKKYNFIYDFEEDITI